ncbi:MAG: AraC family transcriptional regulator [Lachnospiraceae bacterium]|nr:AraC family transcriptional regulator [Lachnospiraceae bacterium]
MLSTEKHVKKGSDYYFYTPSVAAAELMLYPTIIGRFTWEPGYVIHRTHLDSFLLMLIEDGSCNIIIDGKEQTATKGQLVLLDCFTEHRYGTREGWQAYWIHFDGKMARPYYDYITRKHGHIVIPYDYENVHYMMGHIYRHFREGKPTYEARISSYITLILGSMLSTEVREQVQGYAGIQKAVTYINEHFAEPLQLQDMADVASLSPYYFSRQFAKETGLTPHQYLIATRISSAKYLLVSTRDTVKEIALKTGFTDESSFCSTFRKREGMTPSSFRNSQL